MTLEWGSFWLLVWISLELSRVQFVSGQLSLVLCGIGALVGVLYSLEVELLALVLLATYSSVFIALALLALHFGPFWMPASVQSTKGFNFGGMAALAVLLGLGFLLGYTNAEVAVVEPCLPLLWQDFTTTARVRIGSFAGVAHLLFFRLFILETLGLNLYLFVGLVSALVLLSVRAAWYDSAATAKSDARAFVSADRLRVVARFRRQTRRTNASRLRWNQK